MMLAGEGVDVRLIWVGKGVHMMIDLGGWWGGCEDPFRWVGWRTVVGGWMKGQFKRVDE